MERQSLIRRETLPPPSCLGGGQRQCAQSSCWVQWWTDKGVPDGFLDVPPRWVGKDIS